MFEALKQEKIGFRKLRDQRLLINGRFAHELVFLPVKDSGADSSRRQITKTVRTGAVRFEAVPVVLNDGGTYAARGKFRQQAFYKPGLAGILHAGNGDDTGSLFHEKNLAFKAVYKHRVP